VLRASQIMKKINLQPDQKRLLKEASLAQVQSELKLIDFYYKELLKREKELY